MKVTANGKTFTFPDGTSNEDIGLAIDDYFSKQKTPAPVQQAQQPQQAPQEMSEVEKSAQKMIEMQENAPTKRGIFSSIGEAFKGKEAEETKDLPEILDSGVFSTVPKTKAAKLAGLLAVTTDPMEMARIIEAQDMDDIAITYNITEDQQPYPVITNRKSGVQTVLNRPGMSKMDVMQGLTGAAMFSLGGAGSSVVKEALRNAAIQGGIETAQEGQGGDFSIGETALAGGLGGGIKAAENFIGTGSRLAKGAPTEETAEQIAEAEARGLNVSTSDVLEPETLAGKFSQNVGEQAPVFGRGKQLAENQRKRQQVLDDYVQDADANYDEILKSLGRKKERIKEAAIKSRQNAVNQVKDLPLESGNTINALDSEIRRLTTLPNGQPRTNVDTGTLDMLNRLADDVITDERFINLDEMRTSLRQKFLQTASGGPAGVDKQIEKRIYAAMTKDMDEVVKGNLSPNEFRQWKRGNLIYGNEAKKLKQSRIKSLFNRGELVSSRDVNNQIFSVHDTERKNLYRSLDGPGRKNARSAIINKMVEDATRGGELSVNSFLTQANKRKDVVQDFFKGQDLREFKGLQKALEATKRSQEAAVATKTGQQAVPYILGGGAVLNLPATIGSLAGAGTLAKVYESIPVRNALLRLSAVPKGSTKFEKHLRQLSNAINVAAQTATEEQTFTGTGG